MNEFKTTRASGIVLTPAAKGYFGVATVFEVNGHQAALITPDIGTLMSLCREWGIDAPIAQFAEPVVVVSRFMRKKQEDSDGLDDGLNP